MSNSDDNAPLGQALPDRARLRELIREINDKSYHQPARDASKNELLLAYSHFIWQKVYQRTGGRVGIADRQTELFDSAYAYLHERASKIAEAVEDRGYSLLNVIAQWIKFWAVDKIRRCDGQSDKRGKGREKQPSTALDTAEGDAESPDEKAIREEIKAAVFSAVANLDGVEQAVILSYFGLDGPEMSLREVADSQDVSLSEAHNARRRAEYKLRQWLKDHDPNK